MYSYFFEIQMSGWFSFNSFQKEFLLIECHKFDWKRKHVFFFWLKMGLPLMECYVKYSKKNVIEYFLKKKYNIEWFFQSSFFIMTLVLKGSFSKTIIYYSLQTDGMNFEFVYFFLFKMTFVIFLMIVTTSRFDYIKITARIIVQI